MDTFNEDSSNVLQYVAHQQQHIETQKRHQPTGYSVPRVNYKDTPSFIPSNASSAKPYSDFTPRFPHTVQSTAPAENDIACTHFGKSWSATISPQTIDLEPRINFGYHSSITEEEASRGLTKMQLKKLSRQLVHSPQHTINAYNTQFYKTKNEPIKANTAASSSLTYKPSLNYQTYDRSLLPMPYSEFPPFSTASPYTKYSADIPSEPAFRNLAEAPIGQQSLAGFQDDKASVDFSLRLKRLLSNTIESILPLLADQNTLIISEEDSIGVFLGILHKFSLRSCVVQHSKSKWYSRRKTSFSFVDVRDFLYYIIRMHQQWKNKSFFEILEMVKKEKVGKIANVSKRSPFVRHDIADKVEHLCAAFKPCCRVPVFDKNKLVRVVSPADLLCILDSYDVVCEIEQATGISIKKAAKKPILTLIESESLLKAMILMERHGYSAIPIVSEKNPDTVLGVITVREIKYLSLDQHEFYSEAILNEPALTFVSFLRKTGRLRNEAYALLPDTACLRDMISVFLGSAFKNSHSVHRIFLVDENDKMTGMVSLTNVMQNLADLLGQFYRVPRKEQLPHSHPAHNRS